MCNYIVCIILCMNNDVWYVLTYVAVRCVNAVFDLQKLHYRLVANIFAHLKGRSRLN